VRGPDDFGQCLNDCFRFRGLGNSRGLRPRAADGISGRLAAVEQERDSTLCQNVHDRRDGVFPEPQIQRRSSEILLFCEMQSLRHCVGRTDHGGACVFQIRLKLESDNEFVFDYENPRSCQWRIGIAAKRAVTRPAVAAGREARLRTGCRRQTIHISHRRRKVPD